MLLKGVSFCMTSTYQRQDFQLITYFKGLSLYQGAEKLKSMRAVQDSLVNAWLQ